MPWRRWHTWRINEACKELPGHSQTELMHMLTPSFSEFIVCTFICFFVAIIQITAYWECSLSTTNLDLSNVHWYKTPMPWKQEKQTYLKEVLIDPFCKSLFLNSVSFIWKTRRIDVRTAFRINFSIDTISSNTGSTNGRNTFIVLQ